MRHLAEAAFRRAAAALCLLLPLAACETTGDPRQGGLLGWSEDKAVERQRTLEGERTAAQGALSQEKQRGTELATRRTQLGAEVQSLQALLDNALTENDALDARLQQLMGQGKAGQTELAGLRQTLEASRRARVAARRARADAPAGPSADQLARHAQAVNHYNQQLHSVVMLLMGR